MTVSDDLRRHAAARVDMAPHIETLQRLATHARTAVELGVRTGVSTWAILDGLPDDGRLVSVDIDRTTPAIVAERCASDPRWTLLLGDDRDPDIQAKLPRGVDLAFIDTSHEYHHTLAELDLCRDLGATVIALHDYVLPDVADAVSGWMIRNPGWWLQIEHSQWGLAVLRR